MKSVSIPRFRLSTLLILFACAAIGLATTRDSLSALRPAIEAAMVVGLLQQLRELIHWHPGDGCGSNGVQLARKFAIGWRVAVAVAMAFFLVVHMTGWSISLLYPDRDQLLFYEPATVIYDLLPTIVLANSVRRWRWTDDSKVKGRNIWMLFGLIAVLLTSYIITDGTLTGYLSHKAIAGIEASIPQQFQRPGVYPDHASEGYRSFWLSVAASLSVAIGAVCLTRASAQRHSTVGLVYAAIFVTCLIVQLLYCQWFYGSEFHRVSPELAGAGFAVQPSDLPTLAILLVLVTTATAYCLSATKQDMVVVSPNLADKLDRRALHETGPCLAVMGLGAAFEFGVLLVGMIREILYPVFSAPSLSAWLQAWLDVGLILNPNVILISAQLLLVFQLCYFRWRRRRDEVQWELPTLSPKKFAANWIAVSAATLAGVPTLAAFGFLFWLGPFNYSGI